MKVLIITVPLGSGHSSCAKAVKQQLDIMNIENNILDLYEYIDPLFKKIIEKAYFYTMKSAIAIRPVASEIYNINENTETSTHIFSNLQNELMATQLYKYIMEYDPDIIICTQVYAAQVIDELKSDGKIRALTCGIITDFTVQTYWEDTKNTDYIVLYSNMLAQQAANRDINADKILPLGIPIKNSFSKKADKTACRQQLGFDTELPAVLIMSGGFGYGKIEAYVKDIDKNCNDLQMVVICGANESLYQDVSTIKTKNKLHVFGYTDMVDTIMDACDLIVTKPGGITTSEALAKKLPIIICEPLPGMEERNMEFLLNTGCALAASKTFSISSCVDIILKNTIRRNALLQCMEYIAKPQASKDICEFLIDKVNQ